MLARLRSLIRGIFRRADFEGAMSEELHFHIETRADDLVRSGMSRDEAQRRATLEFDGLNTVQGECRNARGLAVFDELGRELRYAARSLRKTPAFTFTALFTIALCLGANLTIFAALDSILLRPLPFPHSEQLVTIFNTYPKAGVDRDGSSVTNYYERRGRIPAFSSISIYRLGTSIVGQSGATNREQVMQVSPEFFKTVGVGPAFGREFNESETNVGADSVAILTDPYWKDHFASDPNVVGRQIRVDGYPRTIVGVLPAGFRFLSSEPQVYVPLSSRPENRGPRDRHSGGNVTQMIARLRPGSTVAQAQSQIDAQNGSLEAGAPWAKMMSDAGFRSVVTPLHADHVASVRPVLLLLQAGVLALLLIGAVNLTNLFLIRASGRAKEVAVRQALGANRLYITSETMVETILLTLVGGVIGLGVAAAGIRLLTALGAERLPLGTLIGFDLRLAIDGVAAALVLGIVLAGPILWFHLGSFRNALQAETRSTTVSRAGQKLRHGFVVAQVALSFALLMGAGLLGLSLKRATAVSPGFQPDRVLTARVSLIGNRYSDLNAGISFTERLAAELDREPGVLFTGFATNLPFSGYNGKSAATVVGYVLRPGQGPRGNYSYGVTGDYFQAMGFTLKAGRFLAASDSRSGRRVCVVDEDFARYYWPNEDPLGRKLFQGGDAGPASEAFTVVGVVGNVKQAGLTEEAGQGAVYYPFAYRADSNLFVAVRGRGESQSLKLIVGSVLRQVDPELALNDVRSMGDRIADSLVTRRSPALLAVLFSAIALLLTGIGTYGVLSYAVAQRRREIAVRMALGAEPSRIRQQFLGVAFRLLIAGMAFGCIGAWLTGRTMQGILFHVTASSPAVLAAAAAVLAAISIMACLIPAQRAARISPTRALAEQ